MWKIKRPSGNAGKSKLRRMLACAGLASATLLFSSGVSAQTNVKKMGGQLPDYHVVQSGDTLYDLSGGYYGDVYQWPRLWSYNPHVTNPHWIYPGDIIYLRSSQQRQGGGDGLASDGSGTASSGELHLPVGGMISNEIEYVGRIVGSPKEANMLSPHDVAWVGFGDESYSEKEKDEIKAKDRREMKQTEEEVKPGDTFAIVREAGVLRNSEGEEVGQKYIVVGALTVTETSEKYWDTAEIVQAWQEIHRGDFLIPYERQLKVVSPVQSDQDMVAEIVDGLATLFNYAEHYYVFVNKGAQDGIRPGNRFFAYQRREGLDFGDSAPDKEVPWRRVGQVMVVDVRESYSIAIVTDSARELNIGDRLEMYAGY